MRPGQRSAVGAMIHKVFKGICEIHVVSQHRLDFNLTMLIGSHEIQTQI